MTANAAKKIIAARADETDLLIDRLTVALREERLAQDRLLATIRRAEQPRSVQTRG